MVTIYTEYLQLRNSALILYGQAEYEAKKNFTANKNILKKEFRNNVYSGQVKKGTQKRIRKALDLLLQSTKNELIYNPISKRYINFRLSFITLTLSSKEIQDHKFCYKNLLKPFLEWLSKTKKVKSYIWKAELQKRDQIHYHITTSNFIHYDEIRTKWNYLQLKNKLIEPNTYPPSTEIKQVYKINNIEHYLAKYIAKAEAENKKLNCKVWGCSENLNKNKLFKIELTKENAESLINNNIQEIIKEEIYLDNCQIIKSEEGYIEKILKGNLINEYKKFIDCIRKNEIYTPDPPLNFREKKETKEIIEYNRISKMFDELNKKAVVKKSTKELFCVDNLNPLTFEFNN